VRRPRPMPASAISANAVQAVRRSAARSTRDGSVLSAD
jgi:hypothetical protein